MLENVRPDLEVRERGMKFYMKISADFVLGQPIHTSIQIHTKVNIRAEGRGHSHRAHNATVDPTLLPYSPQKRYTT